MAARIGAEEWGGGGGDWVRLGLGGGGGGVGTFSASICSEKR